MRENLTLAAWVKLHISTREKFERVEQVMAVVREEKERESCEKNEVVKSTHFLDRRACWILLTQ